MDADKANALFEKGAILLLLDFPEGSEFGIDYNSWTVGPNFRGVKMIPSGIHFVYYSAINSDKQAGPRSGFFYNFSAKEIVVKKWDKQSEDISDYSPDEEEMNRFHRNKHEMDRFLGPYPYERYKEWVSLSSHLSDETLALLEPDCGCVYSASQFESEGSTSESRKLAESARNQNEQDEGKAIETPPKGLPEMSDVLETVIKYSKIPKKYPDNATPSEITKYSMDSTFALNTLISQRFRDRYEGILGEIQFAFLCFILGQNYDSFEQWKKLVHLVCTSGAAAQEHPEMFQSFIALLHFQIREIPSDFFVDIVTSNNFLTSTLHELFQNLICDGVDEKLRKRAISFRKHLTDKFKWDFTSEPDEDAPVVVEET